MVVRGLLIQTLAGRAGASGASAGDQVGPGGEGVVEDLLAAGLYGPGGAVVDRGRGVQADPGMAVLVVVVGEEDVAECACVVQGGEGAGKTGQYLRVLNAASEYGLSLETCGREWLRVMFRSVSRVATFLEVIEVPLSAWM